MTGKNSRRPSPLQRRVLIVLAALGAKGPGPVATRDIERVLEQGGDAPVYGPNLRASCRRMEAAGWLRTLRAPNLQLAVGLTDAGRALLRQDARLFVSQKRGGQRAAWRSSARRRSGLCPWFRADRRMRLTTGRWSWTVAGTWRAGATT